MFSFWDARSFAIPVHQHKYARRALWKTEEAVEFATLEWLSWFNRHRLLEPIRYVPPEKAESNCYLQLSSQTTEVAV